MSAPYSVRDQEPGAVTSVGFAVLNALMALGRLPLMAILRLVGPVIRVMLGTLGVLSLFTAALFEVASHLPTRSLICLVAFGVGCGLLLLLYETILSRISR